MLLRHKGFLRVKENKTTLVERKDNIGAEFHEDRRWQLTDKVKKILSIYMNA